MKKKILSIFMIIAFVVGAMAGCTQKEQPVQQEQNNEEETLAYDVIIMGLDDTFAPMGFRDNNDELAGFDVDLANAVSEEIGIPIEFQPIDWGMKETELNNGNIDIIWNGYTITDERKEKVLFTQPYIANKQIVITLADSDINTLEDLAGKNISLQAESSAVDAVEAKPEVSGLFGNLYSFETYDLCLLDLEAGRSDAVVGDEVFLKYYVSIKGEENYKILEEDFGKEEYGIGVRKDDTALCDAINLALETIKANGVGEEISVKWFGENILY